MANNVERYDSKKLVIPDIEGINNFFNIKSIQNRHETG